MNVAMISGSTFAGQVLNTAFMPLVSRLYSPTEYGSLTAYMSLLGIYGVGALEYSRGIVIPDDDEQAIDVLALSLVVLTITTVIGGVLLSTFDSELTAQYRFYLIAGMFASGLYKIFVQWAFRERNYVAVSKTKIMQATSGNLAKVVLGALGVGEVGLLVGGILKVGAGVTVLSNPFLKKHWKALRAVQYRNILLSAKRFKEFPMYQFPSELLKKIGAQLPVLVISAVYGTSSVGFFGLANGVLNVPMTLIGMSVGDVFYGEAAKLGRTDPRKVMDLSLRLMKRLALIGALPFLVLISLGPQLFSFVFGQQWFTAGLYCRPLALLSYVMFVFAPSSRIYEIFERQKDKLIINLVGVVLTLIAFWVALYADLSAFQAVGLYSLALSAIHVTAYLRAQRILTEEIAALSGREHE